MDVTFRQGTINDTLEIEELYNSVSDYFSVNINYCGWKRGVYPAREDVEKDIADETSYVAIIDSKIAGVIVLSHEPVQNPDNGSWLIDAKPEEVFNIYRFAVHPGFSCCGIGTLILDFADKLAKEKGVKSVRLDVYEGNLPAIKSYEKHGYSYIDTVDLGLGCYGLDWFRLYEKVID